MAATELNRFVAICAAAHGAGATTLSYLLGRFLAVEAPDATPVLLIDCAGDGGLASCAGRSSAHSLDELALATAARRLSVPELFDDLGGGVRLISRAAPSELAAADASNGETPALSRILRDAREAHAFTVADCGDVSTSPARAAIGLATHVVWVTSANTPSLSTVRERLARAAARPAASEILLARRDPSETDPPIRELAAVAQDRRVPLALMPAVGTGNGPRWLRDALELSGPTLEGLRRAVSR